VVDETTEPDSAEQLVLPAPPEQPERPELPAPLGIEPVVTGDDAVDRALARLAGADTLATHEHVAMYEDVHADLRETLDALDRQAEAPGPVPGPVPGSVPTPGPVPSHPNRS
jgi:hypothetical protein